MQMTSLCIIIAVVLCWVAVLVAFWAFWLALIFAALYRGGGQM